MLTWTVSNAATVTLSPGIGSVPNSGTYSVSPGYTTTYTLTATNSGGSVSASTTVTVTPYVSAITSSSSQIAGGESNILTSGFSGGNGPVDSRLLYILLLGLLAVSAAVAIVFVVRKPAAAYAGHHAGTRAGYLPWANATQAANGAPATTPVDSGPGPKFILSNGEQIPISGNAGSLGRSDFRSLVKPDKADLISRQHIRLDCEDGECYIEDRNSTNGTKLNGSSIDGKGRYLLREGDKVELADILTLTFET
ncbi:MAG: FHA domain-containing protein [Dehalococcoidia bacterium]